MVEKLQTRLPSHEPEEKSHDLDRISDALLRMDRLEAYVKSGTDQEVLDKIAVSLRSVVEELYVEGDEDSGDESIVREESDVPAQNVTSTELGEEREAPSVSVDSELLTSSEHSIATEMLKSLGHDALTGVDDPYESLVESYTHDPKEVLAVARESLMAIGADKTLTKYEKAERLDEGLDALFDLTVKLDHAAFPPTAPGEIREGVPEYVPDGFVDMGKYRSTRPHERVEPGDANPREQIAVDKRAMLEKYKPFLKDLMMHDFSSLDLQSKKRRLAIETAKEIYRSMSYNMSASENLGGDLVNLSTVPEGVCRHQGLTFQVLCQTLGLKSRLLKAYMDGERHSTNMLRIDGRWYIFDVTNPDYQRTPVGNEWRPGAYEVSGPPAGNTRTRYNVTGKFSGDKHTYLAHNDMYWRILDPEGSDSSR